MSGKIVWNSTLSSGSQFYYATVSFKWADGACGRDSNPHQVVHMLPYIS